MRNIRILKVFKFAVGLAVVTAKHECSVAVVIVISFACGNFRRCFVVAEGDLIGTNYSLRFQIVQKKIDCIEIKVVALSGRTPSEGDRARIISATTAMVRPGVTIEFEVVSELPPSESGKFRPHYTLVGGSP